MPDLLTELQSALAEGMPIKGITDNDIGRWKTGIVPQSMWEDAVVGALMRFCWERNLHVSTFMNTAVIGFLADGTGPLPLLRSVRNAWEASDDQ